MNKKSLIILLPVILLGCNNPSTLITPEKIESASIVLPSSFPSANTIITDTGLDLNNSFELANLELDYDAPLAYSFDGKINKKGDGLIILKTII